MVLNNICGDTYCFTFELEVDFVPKNNENIYIYIPSSNR